MVSPLGDLRNYPTSCMAVLDGKQCRAPTRNPNCFCLRHQRLTSVSRFDWVTPVDDAALFFHQQLSEKERLDAHVCQMLQKAISGTHYTLALVTDD